MPRTHAWRNSDLPAPVVPPTNACGPWVLRSRYSGAPAPIPTKAAIDISGTACTAAPGERSMMELEACQCSMTASGLSASSLPVRVTYEMEPGKSESSSTGTPASTTGASERARRIMSSRPTRSTAMPESTRDPETSPIDAVRSSMATNDRHAAGSSAKLMELHTK